MKCIKTASGYVRCDKIVRLLDHGGRCYVSLSGHMDGETSDVEIPGTAEETRKLLGWEVVNGDTA